MYTNVTGILAAAVATGGTFTVGYPTGTTRGDFSLGVRSRLSVLGKVFSAPEDMTLSFGASSVTVTYNGATTLPQGSRFTFQFDNGIDVNPLVDGRSGQRIAAPCDAYLVELGSPGTASATAYALAQAVAGAGNLTLAGALASNGVCTADARTGRNVVAVSSNAGDTTQTLTITGTDMYGVSMVERITLNGTSTVAGVKAFKTITQIAVSAACAGNVSVGNGNVIGLPVHLPNANMILKENLNGAAATAGTTVAALALSTKPTINNADIRGTYTPNSAPDGSKAYTLLVALPTPTFLGPVQYTQ